MKNKYNVVKSRESRHSSFVLVLELLTQVSPPVQQNIKDILVVPI